MSEAPLRPPRRSDASTATPAGLNEVEKFQWLYREAYAKVDAAISFIAENKDSEAGPLLESGLSLLNQAIDVNISSLSVDENTAKSYAEMQTKMRSTRKKVEEHLATNKLFSGVVGPSGYPMVADAPALLDASRDGVHYPELPGEESTPRVSLPPTPSPATSAPQLELGGAGLSPLVTPLMSPQEGTLLFRIEEGVQIFFIYPDGRVTSPSYPSFLEIVTLNTPLNIASVGGSAGGFLQVGEWSYPLVKATSPVLHSSYGAYMFPDFANPVPGSHVGIIIPDWVSKDQRDLFESILNQMTSYHEQPQQPTNLAAAAAEGVAAGRQSKTERIASGLVAGAERVSSTLVWGANKMSELLAQGSERLQQSGPPAGSDPTVQPTKIDPKLQTTAKAARVVSGKAVQVSGYILGQVGKAAVGLGRKLAPHVQHHGARAYSSVTGQSSQQSSAQVDGALDVAAGALKGASTIYMALEESAKTLVCSLTDNTVKVVTHKYGPEAGEFTDNAMYAVGQSAMAGHNIASLGVKGVAKKAAKGTGKAIVESHHEKKAAKAAALDDKAADADEVVEGMELGEEAQEDNGFVIVEKGQEAKEKP